MGAIALIGEKYGTRILHQRNSCHAVVSMSLFFGSGKICSVDRVTNKMSLALQLSPGTESSGMEAGAGELVSEDNSSTLADLVSMFPSLDHDVVLMVLEAHNGSIEAAVEYLMNTNGGGGATQPLVTAGGGYGTLGYLDPARDMVGQFSADIGGLPEVLPRCLLDDYGVQEGEGESDQESQQGRSDGHLLPQQGTVGWLEQDAENDPLPTYSEACREQAPLDRSRPESVSAEEDQFGLNLVVVASGKQGSEASASSSSNKSKCT